MNARATLGGIPGDGEAVETRPTFGLPHRTGTIVVPLEHYPRVAALMAAGVPVAYHGPVRTSGGASAVSFDAIITSATVAGVGILVGFEQSGPPAA